MVNRMIQAIGISIIQFMRQLVDKAAEQFNHNYTFLATPAEGLSGRFIGMDRELFGLVPELQTVNTTVTVFISRWIVIFRYLKKYLRRVLITNTPMLGI